MSRAQQQAEKGEMWPVCSFGVCAKADVGTWFASFARCVALMLLQAAAAGTEGRDVAGVSVYFLRVCGFWARVRSRFDPCVGVVCASV